MISTNLTRCAAAAMLLPLIGAAAAQVPALTGREWRTVALGGLAVPAAGAPTLTLGADGRASGFSGCNRYSGSYSLAGGTLTPGPLATTRMACPPPMMATESLFLGILSGPLTATLSADGSLTLSAADGRTMVLR